MALSINRNPSSQILARYLSLTESRLARSSERLATGFRINRGADDPSGLGMSEGMRRQIRGAQQGIANAQFGVSMIQTADGALGETTSILQRMRELAVQAGSNTLSTAERTAIGSELVSLREEIDNISARTTFNGKSLLTGAYNVKTASTIGPINDLVDADTVNVGINVRVADANTTYNVTVAGSDVTMTNATTGAFQTITVSNLVGDGTTQALNFDQLGVELNLTAKQGVGGDGTIASTDIAAGLNGRSVVTTGETAASTIRVGSDVGDNIGVSFGTKVLARSLGTAPDKRLSDLIRDDQAAATVGQANTLLDSVDAALGQVSAERSRLGGSQNQLEYAIASQESLVSNISIAESQIRDTDIAAETARQAVLTIQYSALTSLLAQANVRNEGLLKLFV